MEVINRLFHRLALDGIFIFRETATQKSDTLYNQTTYIKRGGQFCTPWIAILLVALLPFLLSFVLPECIVRGTVYNCYTNQPMKNIKVRVIEQHPKAFDLWGNYITNVKSEYETDSNGNYFMNFKYSKKNKTEYKIELNCASTHMLDGKIKLKNGLQPKHYYVLMEENNYVNLYFAPTGTLSLLVNNGSYFDKNDSIGVELSGGIIFPLTVFERKGQVINEKSTRYIPSDFPITIKWTSKKNGKVDLHTDTITVKENENYIYKINF